MRNGWVEKELSLKRTAYGRVRQGFWVLWVVGFGFLGLWNLSKWVVGFGKQPELGKHKAELREHRGPVERRKDYLGPGLSRARATLSKG